MQLAHADGWRLLHLARIDGSGSCLRLCRNSEWIGDYGAPELPNGLAAHGLHIDNFSPADIERCVVVDPSSRTACMRITEHVDGRAHLPLCAACRHTLARMHGFPRQPETRTPAAAMPALTDRWCDLHNEHEQRELAHLIRHPLAKIIGWAEILHDDDSLAPVHARHLSVIQESATELQQLIETLFSTWVLEPKTS